MTGTTIEVRTAVAMDPVADEFTTRGWGSTNDLRVFSVISCGDNAKVSIDAGMEGRDGNGHGLWFPVAKTAVPKHLRPAVDAAVAVNRLAYQAVLSGLDNAEPEVTAIVTRCDQHPQQALHRHGDDLFAPCTGDRACWVSGHPKGIHSREDRRG